MLSLSQAVAKSLVQKGILDRRAQLALRAVRVFRAPLDLRDSKVLKALRGRRVTPVRLAPPFDQCKQTAQSVATLARHWCRFSARAVAPPTERSAVQRRLLVFV